MRKRLAYAAGALFLLAVAAAVLVRLVDLEAFKPRLVTAASRASGMEVRVDGRLGIGLFPGFHVRAEGLRVRNRGTELVDVKEARLGLEILPLLRREIRVGSIVLRNPRLVVERDRHGRFNFEPEEEPGEKRGGDAGKEGPELDVGKISLADASVRYRDRGTGKDVSAEGLDLTVRSLRVRRGEPLKKAALTGDIACREIRAGSLVVSGIAARIRAGDGAIDVSPLALRIFGGEGKGSFHADFSGAVPRYRLDISVPALRIAEFLKTFSPETVANGSMALSARLSAHGRTSKEATATAAGAVSLRGENLALEGIDLDRALARYESSQSFNLFDVGAFVLAGPFGPALTKGYDFANAFRGHGGTTRVRKLVSDWDVERGAARSRDVALATDENRVALKGSLDFVGERFDDVVVAVVDGKGCPTLRQKVRGPFRKPEVEKVGALRSLAGPVLNLFRKTREFVAGKECNEPFYAGSVPPPK